MNTKPTLEFLQTRHFPDLCSALARVKHCENWGCHNELKKYPEVFFGRVSDYTKYVDFEYSFKTGYCRECAEKLARENWERAQWVDYTFEVKREETVLGTKQYFSDGSICEVTEESIRWAAKSHRYKG